MEVDPQKQARVNGMRDSIQSQSMTARQSNEFSFMRSSIDHKTIGTPDLNLVPHARAAMSPHLRSRVANKTEGKQYTADHSLNHATQHDTSANASERNNFSAHNGKAKRPWQKTKNEGHDKYLDYLKNKKPLLPALIKNQINQSRLRHKIERGLNQSIDVNVRSLNK